MLPGNFLQARPTSFSPSKQGLPPPRCTKSGGENAFIKGKWLPQTTCSSPLSPTHLEIVGGDGDARALLDEQRVVADDDERVPVRLGEDVEHHLALGPRHPVSPAARFHQELHGVFGGDARVWYAIQCT